ncbi:MAG: hypothetical protein A2252_01045 [Elusimicrobia bacterium RIFOXYA2_FULL_39_19]|nr:MAG: hypothetical protein A2252_01045 [Elusimicrobia bacterium RIFOXYA2_FULL_39_19]
MVKLTSKERMLRVFEHKNPDRIPVYDCPWPTTIERWRKEGMPENTWYADYFDIDQIIPIDLDNSPQYPEKIIEETSEYKITTSKWGATFKKWKHAESTPEFMDFKIKDPDSWKEAKARMVPSEDRIDWNYLKANYKTWREQGAWIQANLWFGFDVTHSWTVGTERLLMALIEDPQWCVDMFNHFLDVELVLYDKLWEKGYEFDSAFWWDDLGYKGNQFFSVNTYRELLKPVHKRAVEWAHAKGVKTHLHSCGDVNPFIPEFINIGIDALNPLEVKAGMNPVEVKKKYGKQLVLHGGINAVLWDDIEKIEAEIKRVLPALKESGGYIFSTDHSVPSNVSLKDFKRIIELVKDIGTY